MPFTSDLVTRYATRDLLPKPPRLRTNSRRWNATPPASVKLADGPSRPADRTQSPQRLAAAPRVTDGVQPLLNLYLREVGEVALLTLEEEGALARRVQAGDAQARDRMIRANLRLVIRIARGYDNLGLPLLDLISEGNIGLMKAVDRFDRAKGAKLSTYSAWWIKQSMRRALASQSRTIRLPLNAVDQICQLRKIEMKLQALLGRKPSEADLAHESGLSLRRVGELRDAGIRPASLDAPLGDEDSSTLAEVVADENTQNPAQHFEDTNSLSRLGDLIDRLPPREAAIIRARFGLHDGHEHTLDGIGAGLGLTRERIRQLQNGALKRLRKMLEDPVAPQAVA
jgi:RNA polymerase primary sigma factor